MPMYGYVCSVCRHEFTALVSHSEADKRQDCPQCGSKEVADREQVPKGVSHELKGGGWARDRYGLKGGE